MSEQNLKSIYKIKIEEYISLKRKLGYKYITAANILGYIDLLAFENNETSLGFTKKFYKRWLNSRPNESYYYRYTRIILFRQFSKHLCNLGIPSYIPLSPRYQANNYVPYIYSKNQMNLIFKYTDDFESKLLSMNSSLFCFPIIIRLLYSTGIRIGEALALKDEDVFLKENFLKIKDSKNGKERLIPLSESMTDALLTYVNYKQKVRNKKQQNYFFTKQNGLRPTYCTILLKFKKCLQLAGIFGNDTTIRPSLHDLRHTFAVTALANMAESGTDLYVSLPILSKYLGHSSISATNHYVRLTANMYPQLINEMDFLTLDIFPKLKNYEND